MSNVLFVSLGTIDETAPDALKEYAAAAPPILAAAGAKARVRAKLSEQLVGSDAPQTVFVAEFPSAEAARSAFQSEEYKALIPIRDKAFRKLDFFLVEEF